MKYKPELSVPFVFNYTTELLLSEVNTLNRGNQEAFSRKNGEFHRACCAIVGRLSILSSHRSLLISILHYGSQLDQVLNTRKDEVAVMALNKIKLQLQLSWIGGVD